MLEGVSQYDIILQLEYPSENILSQPDHLSRIYVFDYGYLVARKNQLTGIILDSGGNKNNNNGNKINF